MEPIWRKKLPGDAPVGHAVRSFIRDHEQYDRKEMRHDSLRQIEPPERFLAAWEFEITDHHWNFVIGLDYDRMYHVFRRQF